MPDDPDLLTIGDFARAVGLPASALRHYDECGLLVPARTDAATGYRYYTPALERRAHLIALMREVSVPIDTMRRVLDAGPGRARIELDELVANREQQAQRVRQVLDIVAASLAAERLPDVVRIGVDGAALAAALRQVREAADVDPSSALACVALDVRNDELDVVATNRHWMARRTLPVAAQVRGQARAVLRLPVVADLVAQLDAAVEVDLVLSDGNLTLDLADELLPVDTSDRPFPSYRLVLEALDAPAARAVVTRVDVLDAVTRARRSIVTVTTGEELGIAGAAVPSVASGKELTIAFRSALVLRALGSCVGDRVVLAVSAPDRPALLTSPDQPGYVAVVMPTLEAS